VSTLFMPARQWLQRQFSLGLTLCWGRGLLGLAPLQLESPMSMQVGSPVALPLKFRANNSVKSEGERVVPTDQEVEDYHQAFVAALGRLFDATKGRNGVVEDARLIIT